MIRFNEFKRSLRSLNDLLAPREVKCSYYVFMGCDNDYIAKRMNIRSFSVKKKLKRIYRKLGINKIKDLNPRVSLMNIVLYDMDNLDSLVDKARSRERNMEFKRHEKRKILNRIEEGDLVEGGRVRKITFKEELKSRLEAYKHSE